MAIQGYQASMVSALRLQDRFTELTRQVSSGGQRAETYAGLGRDATRASSLASQLNQRQALQNVAERGEGRAAYTQTVMDRLAGIAGEMADKAASLNGTMSSLTQIRETARAALEEVATLLNERYEGEAIFGGSDLENDPVAAAGRMQQTGMFTGIGALLDEYGSNGGDLDALFGQIADLAGSNEDGVSPFSSYANEAAAGTVADSRRAVPTGGGTGIEVGLYANRNAAIGQSGSQTGSWSRDLIMGLTVLANLTEEQAAQENFSALVQKTVGVLRDAGSGANDEIGALGDAQARLTAAADQHKAVYDQIETQLGDLTTVDVAEAQVRLQQVNLQLQGSYQALAMLGRISLVNYL
ncbi:flagellin [Pseudoroseomonas cervicalis]|uniref:flagellin n=1 Tax=Teichococcus cervicalis TaxID=204525 RepID=UPI00278AED0A|nr:flagellin [Pseudoroseomonas cervicalis]MDQ1079541.1 flagellar hook-associated protein 3 FlgL [Pseudoroseomonas cervicalis]